MSPDIAAEAARPSAGPRVAAVVAALALLGVIAGVVWWWVWEPSYYVVSEGRGAMAEPDLGRRFAADGWFAVIGAASGLLCGLVVTWRFRSHRILSVLALAVGSFVAVGAMRLTGLLLGPGDTDAALAAAQEGARVPIELAVTVPAFYLAWPVAALAGACVVLWGGTDRAPVVHRTAVAGRSQHAEPWGPGAGYPQPQDTTTADYETR